MNINTVKFPSTRWCDLTGVVVLDADGWDRKNGFRASWNEQITIVTFYNRCCNSTLPSGLAMSLEDMILKASAALEKEKANVVEVVLNGNKYQLDVAQAKHLGVLTEVSIQDFREGDIFSSVDGYTKVVVIRDSVDEYVYGGFDGNPFRLYSDFQRTKEEVLEHLNDSFPIFVKHLDLSLNGQPPKESEL